MLKSKGLVESYEIYRSLGFAPGSSKIATISDSSSWVDTSKEAKTETFMLSYYIIAHAKNGSNSTLSNYVTVNIMNRILSQ
ncbi:MAG: hypothetical protein APF81_07525 [Desulfosporosinus sp. BRH_c37]|nr:MAG: hypothetical protein APF81_07525 [Desulfosporosinus sp. BRH_c37]